MKTFVLDSNLIMTQGCIVEDGRLLRYDISYGEETRLAGNIYKGRVTNVNKDKKHAFVDIGLEKNGMINFKDVTDDVTLNGGQEILVQVISDPYENKGAKLTTELSFQGKYLVLLSGTGSIGLSRKIPSEEKRTFLNRKIKEFIGDKPFVGAVVRTEAAKASIDDLRQEFDLLMNQLNQTLNYRVLGNAPKLLRKEQDLLEQYIKMYSPEDKWITNDKALYEKSLERLGKKAVEYYAGHNLFDYTRCKNDIERIKAHKLPLKSGGELVIDYTEACTVIDVNSGKEKKGTPSSDALFKINCEAMEETKWFLEKGNISGAIIVDLMGIGNSANQKRLLDAAKEIFKRSDCYVAGLSALGFLEITRKRVSKPAHKIFEFRKPLNESWQYETNDLYALNTFINEIRRMMTHYNGKHYKILCKSSFKDVIINSGVILSSGQFYENKTVTVDLIVDRDIETQFKITY